MGRWIVDRSPKLSAGGQSRIFERKLSGEDEEIPVFPKVTVSDDVTVLQNDVRGHFVFAFPFSKNVIHWNRVGRWAEVIVKPIIRVRQQPEG